jgi:hypothetical protein
MSLMNSCAAIIPLHLLYNLFDTLGIEPEFVRNGPKGGAFRSARGDCLIAFGRWLHALAQHVKPTREYWQSIWILPLNTSGVWKRG